MTQDKRPVTLITGASAGIGAALAREFAANGHELLLVARREPALVALADAIAEKGAADDPFRGCRAHGRGAGDCRSTRAARPRARGDRQQRGRRAHRRRGQARSRAEQLAVIDLNVRALTDLSLAFVDSLKRRRGGILNVASLAASMPGPGRAVYYASKAYVLSFSEALHRELKPHGVRVTVLCPGPVPTALQARAGMTGFLPRLFMRSAEEVAREAYRGLSQGRRMVVPGFANRAVTTAIRLSPRSLWLELIARQQRRVPPSAPLAF